MCRTYDATKVYKIYKGTDRNRPLPLKEITSGYGGYFHPGETYVPCLINYKQVKKILN